MSVGDVQGAIRVSLVARGGKVLDVPRAGCRHRAPAALRRNVCLGSATEGKASAATSVLSHNNYYYCSLVVKVCGISHVRYVSA